MSEQRKASFLTSLASDLIKRSVVAGFQNNELLKPFNDFQKRARAALYLLVINCLCAYLSQFMNAILT